MNYKYTSPPIKTSNSTSIVCIVVFPDVEDPVSHYLAGDADGELELRVAAWVNTKVTTMKLSHHGSSTSSPLKLVKLYSPKTIVVSAGNRHSHPSEDPILSYPSSLCSICAEIRALRARLANTSCACMVLAEMRSFKGIPLADTFPILASIGRYGVPKENFRHKHTGGQDTVSSRLDETRATDRERIIEKCDEQHKIKRKLYKEKDILVDRKPVVLDVEGRQVFNV